ncbi:hypothetical protein JCM17846_27590 [Iodidimonas nitroreducens]|uniref:Quercetin 2,3-dioxygenase n=1 Tax=Iodidimonas nitroreducens TaxID=1236968 RepID=A0A5A7NAX8_9PROT|nr:pirin family protein [Iodidimonas nitroreducens]GAK33123.1 putative quercetin 2,3-dioxygenase [alpha proteobacterium Q-1]GER05077.1 hypothetical protein JCM17846_27590 [Iodidimonas nitroreducens]
MASMNKSGRQISKKVAGVPSSDGAGVKMRRLIASPLLDYVDPFLLLDEFRTDRPGDYIGGFPDHPHRGFETVTYMLAGRMRHGDNKGNQGLLRPGSVQWMTAGRGIIHSEMPEQENGLMWGFQLWVNLPADKKMIAPRYQDIQPEDIPQIEREDGIRIKLIAGEVDGVKGAVDGIATHPVFLDIALPQDLSFSHDLPSTHNCFVYPYDGDIAIGSGDEAQLLPHQQLAVLSPGDQVEIIGKSPLSRFILVAGQPLHEPVARYGPFVMNTADQLRQAVADFQAGRF